MELLQAPFLTWLTYEVANSVMMAWLYNATGGSLPDCLGRSRWFESRPEFSRQTPHSFQIARTHVLCSGVAGGPRERPAKFSAKRSVGPKCLEVASRQG